MYTKPVNILNVAVVESALSHYSVRTRYPQVTRWVMTVGRNYLFSGASKMANENFNLYEPPGPGELEIPSPADLPDWAKCAFAAGKPIHVFNTTQFGARTYWQTLDACIQWLNCIQPDDPTLNRLDRMGFDFVAGKANGWREDITKNPWFHIKDKAKTFYEFGDKWRWAILETPLQFEREGELMNHCVGGPTYQGRAATKAYLYLSLRDPKNEPHATMEVDMNNQLFSLEKLQALSHRTHPHVLQVRGNSNQVLKPEYSRRMDELVKWAKWTH